MLGDKIALMEGSPAFAEKLFVGRPNLGDHHEILSGMSEMLRNKWLTNNGPNVQELEQRIAKFLGVRNCVACCNATIGLEVAIRALGLSGEVIIPSFTFVATAHALQWQGITPVFCDIEQNRHTIDPDCIEALITPRTTAILGVHLWGNACNVPALENLAKRYNLKLLFDAAHAFGCSSGGRMIGGWGDAEVFSFHATKFFNTLEGGAIVTNDDDLAESVRLMINFGFSGFDNVIHIGTNGKMNEASAVVGLAGLPCIEEFITINKRNYYSYLRGLEGIPGIYPMRYDEEERGNYQYIIFEIDEKKAGLARDELIQVLHAENIIARRYFFPGCHRMEPYRSLFPDVGVRLPVTEWIASRCISLPTGSAVGDKEIDVICRIIRNAISHSGIVREYIAGMNNGPTRE